MKKHGFLTRLITPFLFAILLFAGCKKESSSTLTTYEEEQVAVFSAESEAESQFVFDDIFNSVMGVHKDVGIGGVGIFGRAAENGRLWGIDSLTCANVSIEPKDPGVFPKTVVIDFGTGCTTHDHLRSGKIITVYTARLTEPGSSATTTFENFKIDSLSVEGTQVITNITAASSNHWEFETNISNARLTKPNGDYTEWNAARTTTQSEGYTTPLPLDDAFRIAGNSNGKTRKGNLLVSWTSEIQEPLLKRFACRWFVKGSVMTVRNGLPSNTPWISLLDFGGGSCDNKASLTINGDTHQITLH